MLAHLFNLHYSLNLTIDQYPHISKFHDWNNQIPQIIFTHGDKVVSVKGCGHPHSLSAGDVINGIPRFQKALESKNVIFLVRDPRAVLASTYFERTKRLYFDPCVRFNGTMEQLVDEERGGFEAILSYYRLYLEVKPKLQRALLVRYEDMVAAPKQALHRIVSFLGLTSVSYETI